MNTARKGYLKEYECAKALEGDGWVIVFAAKRTAYNKKVDFGITNTPQTFDIVAIKGRRWKFISVKTTKNYNNYLPVQLAIQEFKRRHGFDGAEFELRIYRNSAWRGRGNKKKYVKGHWEIIDF